MVPNKSHDNAQKLFGPCNPGKGRCAKNRPGSEVGKRSDVISDGDGKPCEGQRKIKIEADSIDNLGWLLIKEQRQFHFERELCIFDKKKV